VAMLNRVDRLSRQARLQGQLLLRESPSKAERPEPIFQVRSCTTSSHGRL